jgi:hypothetical protein
MPSLQSSVLRCLLRLRKATLRRHASVEMWRLAARRGQWLFRPPRGVEIRPASVDGMEAEGIVPPASLRGRSSCIYTAVDGPLGGMASPGGWWRRFAQPLAFAPLHWIIALLLNILFQPP